MTRALSGQPSTVSFVVSFLLLFPPLVGHGAEIHSNTIGGGRWTDQESWHGNTGEGSLPDNTL